MPPRAAATERQQRLGAELRKLRQRAGLNSREAGELLNVNSARISSIEAGRFGVSADRVRMFAHSYGCSDETYIEALATMTAGRARNWWDEYRETLPSGLLDLAELEHHATAIRTAQVAHIPGLFQTVDYARLIFRQSIPQLSPPEIEYRVSHRIKRQGILFAADPTPFTAVIHEAALRMRFGDRDVTRRQLEQVMEMSELNHVTVLAIPYAAGIFPGAGQTVLYADGPVTQLDTVQLDAEHGSVFLHADLQLEKYRTFMTRFEAVALKEPASRDLIREIINDL
ncbi:helix-turn-helix transcriptional regulator [Streptomyces scabiei]|uniref:helix-turn-helix domain-containing protein n=1 Tax=Streptomyces scabiei TaxID=1930 RepID=UPI00298F9F82|nr:helix-turn-helix transcriptional regulator [Streptomyces scabiei]MDW8807206.1 helix-turn-helix transcriptional regulator [Streptomyces scabiei]